MKVKLDTVRRQLQQYYRYLGYGPVRVTKEVKRDLKRAREEYLRQRDEYTVRDNEVEEFQLGFLFFWSYTREGYAYWSIRDVVLAQHTPYAY